MYIGNGMIEIALAVLGARIFVKNTGMMMNLSHGFYGLSSTVAPLIATGLMQVSIGGTVLDWRGMYLAVLMFSLLPVIFTLMSKFPEEEKGSEERAPFRSVLKDPVVWLIVSVLTFGVVSELAVGGWLVYYLEKAYGWDPVRASGLLSLFFLFFSIARIGLGLVTDKIGYTLSLILFSCSSALCTFIALIGGESVAFLFALSGIGIAMIYPTVMAFIAKRYPSNTDTVITFTVTVMGLGSVIGNYLIGGVIEGVKRWYADADLGLIRGLQAGYGFIGLLAALSAACAFILYIVLRKK